MKFWVLEGLCWVLFGNSPQRAQRTQRKKIYLSVFSVVKNFFLKFRTPDLIGGKFNSKDFG